MLLVLFVVLVEIESMDGVHSPATFLLAVECKVGVVMVKSMMV